ncbi:MAG: streptogramin lyase [Planctomycetota bacterium]|jgi:streptogramin lyase
MHTPVRIAAILAFSCMTPDWAAAQAQELPTALDPFLMTERHGDRQSEVQVLGGLEMNTMVVFSALPYLVWPEGSTQLPMDRSAVARWLSAAGTQLGHAGLNAAFESSSERAGGLLTWTYQLRVGEVPVQGYGLRLFWRNGQLEGLLNDIPGPTAGVTPFAGNAPEGASYLSTQVADRSYQLQPATSTTTVDAGVQRRVVQGPQFSVTTVSWTAAALASEITPIDHEMTIWPLSMGTFPDQIDTDSSGNVWFSQPSNDVVTRFNPITENFTSYLTQPGGVPDGLMVSRNNEVYSGLYNIGRLGVLDTTTYIHSSYASPTNVSTLAIPTQTTNDTIIVTEHAGRIVEWDPATQTWIRNLLIPTPNPHVVSGVEAPGKIVWFTQFNSNELGRLDLTTGVYTEVSIPGGGGPAFAAISDGKVWFSLWTRDEMGYFDPQTGGFTFFDFGMPTQVGGPLFTAPNGDVACGTRGSGFIMVHDKSLGILRKFPIPNNNPGLKDGLTVAADGAIWYTLSSANRIGRLVYPH